jgi:hypothetical protein
MRRAAQTEGAHASTTLSFECFAEFSGNELLERFACTPSARRQVRATEPRFARSSKLAIAVRRERSPTGRSTST